MKWMGELYLYGNRDSLSDSDEDSDSEFNEYEYERDIDKAYDMEFAQLLGH